MESQSNNNSGSNMILAPCMYSDVQEEGCWLSSAVTTTLELSSTDGKAQVTNTMSKSYNNKTFDNMSDSSSESNDWNMSEDRPALKEKNAPRVNNKGKITSAMMGYKHVPHREKPPQIVERRNARERRRVQAVNCAFSRLRKVVPIENTRGKRISKVKTLQKAIEYINSLQELLQEDGSFNSIELQSYYRFTQDYFMDILDDLQEDFHFESKIN